MKRFEPTPVQGFTTEELVQLRRIINRTWDSIAGDMFLDENGEYDPYLTFDRFEVAEVSLDADRWKWQGEKKGDGAIIDKLQNLGWGNNSWKEVIIQVLPFEIYGY